MIEDQDGRGRGIWKQKQLKSFYFSRILNCKPQNQNQNRTTTEQKQSNQKLKTNFLISLSVKQKQQLKFNNYSSINNYRMSSIRKQKKNKNKTKNQKL